MGELEIEGIESWRKDEESEPEKFGISTFPAGYMASITGRKPCSHR